MTLSDVVIVSISSLAAFFDLWVRKIPNWLIGAGALCGFMLNAFHGYRYASQSVLGFLVGIAVLLLPFALGWIGAGDVKYFGVIGALLGVSWLPRVFFYSAIAGGLIAIGYLAVGLARMPRFKDFWLDFKTAVVSGGNVLPDGVSARPHERGSSVPWGVAFAAGTIIAYYWDPTGQWASF